MELRNEQVSNCKRKDLEKKSKRTEATPTSSVVNPRTARALRSGAIVGSAPLSIPKVPSASDSCRLASPSFLLTFKADPGLFVNTIDSIQVKLAAGFNVSFNDFYGRALSYHLINETGPANGIGPGPGCRTL